MSIRTDFLLIFCILRPAKHKRRWGHNLQGAQFLLCFGRCSDYFTENMSWSCKLWQNNDVLRKHPSFSEKIRKLPFSIIRTTDYSKGFLWSLALRIIEVWLYMETKLGDIDSVDQVPRYSLKLKIKRNDWLLTDTCPQAANHCALFWAWIFREGWIYMKILELFQKWSWVNACCFCHRLLT